MKKLLLLSFLFSLFTFNSNAQWLNCIENALIDAQFNCPTVADSVCGCDGNGYLNPCEAIYHFGITHFTHDPCSGNGAGCHADFFLVEDQGTFSFYDSSSASGTQTFSWDFGDGSPISNDPAPSHIYSATGYYTVCLTIDDQGVCTSTSCRVVYFQGGVPCNAISNFSYTATGTSDNTVNFSNLSSGTGALTYNWYFGDGDSSTSANPIHDYDSCNYDVQLIITDSLGCSSDTTISIDACFNGVPTFNSVLNSMSVYPNPAKDNINLLLNSRFNSNVILTVKDVTGRNVVESIPVHLNAGKNNYKLDLPKLPAGVYIIQINDDFGMMNTRVLIK